MNKFCTNCGSPLNEGDKFCTVCGFKTDFAPTEKASNTEEETEKKVEVTEESEKSKTDDKTSPEKATENKKKPKKKKKHGCLTFFLVIIGIILAAFLFYITFGSLISLSSYGDKVALSISTGNLNLDGASSDYQSLPPYVKDMLGEEKADGENGELMMAILPYIRAEKESVKGLFGNYKVEYRISAPDMESYILSQDFSVFASEDEMLYSMINYIPTAPYRTQNVTVKYYKSGFFSKKWRGNYATTEFANAISGGMNNAYSQLYAEMLEEMGVELK